LPADEQAELIRTVTAAGAAVAKRKPALEQAYAVFAAAANRTQ